MTLQLDRPAPLTESWMPTTQTLRELDEVPRCSHSVTERDRRACRALQLGRDGMPWPMVAREVGYPNGRQAREQAVKHLEAEVGFIAAS